MSRRLPLCLAVAVAVVGVSCSNHRRAAIIKPAPPLPPTTTTVFVDLSAVDLGGVAGKTTTTTIAMGPGGAGINGTVTGPQGPVPGATVRIDRLVGDAVTSAIISSNADGSFGIGNIQGGLYRVRAYLPAPYNLSQVTPQVFFLGGNEARSLNLQLALYNGLAVASSTAPDPPTVGQPTNVIVQVTIQAVDGQGVVRGTAVPNVKVQLFGSGWRTDTANPTITDSRGQAFFQVRCAAQGPQALSTVVADTTSSALEVGDCVAPPPRATTTTLPGPTTTTRPTIPGATTTTPPTTTGSTTSTTKR